MSNRYLKNNTKAKKGISPVIATVILVAVAVVIAAALAGFSSSLFGSYSQGSQITIRSVTMGVTDDGTDTNELDVVNKGGAPETVVRISAAGYADATIDPLTDTIDANNEMTVLFGSMGFVAADEGKTITLTVHTESGQAYTLSTVVQS